MKYLDPKNGLVFKKIFGEHHDITISFLNALLEFEGDSTIEELEFIDPNLVPETPLSKYTIVDVRCKDRKGRQFVIEMQMLWSESFKSRVLFNACKNYVRQLSKGGQHERLKPVYSLCLVNEDFLKHEGFLHRYKIQHQEQEDQIIEGLEFVFVELQKFKHQNNSDIRMMVLWLRFLTEVDEATKEISPALAKSKEILKAIQLLEATAFTKDEMLLYDKYWDSIRTEKTLIDDALIKGERIGIEKGREEERIITACKMLKKQMPLDLIAELTGLSLEQLEKLDCD